MARLSPEGGATVHRCGPSDRATPRKRLSREAARQATDASHAIVARVGIPSATSTAKSSTSSMRQLLGHGECAFGQFVDGDPIEVANGAAHPHVCRADQLGPGCRPPRGGRRRRIPPSRRSSRCRGRPMIVMPTASMNASPHRSPIAMSAALLMVCTHGYSPSVSSTQSSAAVWLAPDSKSSSTPSSASASRDFPRHDADGARKSVLCGRSPRAPPRQAPPPTVRRRRRSPVWSGVRRRAPAARPRRGHLGSRSRTRRLG